MSLSIYHKDIKYQSNLSEKSEIANKIKRKRRRKNRTVIHFAFWVLNEKKKLRWKSFSSISKFFYFSDSSSKSFHHLRLHNFSCHILSIIIYSFIIILFLCVHHLFRKDQSSIFISETNRARRHVINILQSETD